jgi:hypothetical protein
MSVILGHPGCKVTLAVLHNPAELSRLVVGGYPCPCSKRPKSDGSIWIIGPIGFRHQLRRITRRVIGDHEFRAGQGDGDVIGLHFDVDIVVIRHQPDTSATSDAAPLPIVPSLTQTPHFPPSSRVVVA